MYHKSDKPKRLTDEEFMQLAFHNYDNPHCVSVEEFEEDLKRLQSLSKLFFRYKNRGELRERLIMNHLIVFINTFGARAANLMLFGRLSEDYHCFLKPFLIYLNCCSSEEYISTPLDQGIVKILREI